MRNKSRRQLEIPNSHREGEKFHKNLLVINVFWRRSRQRWRNSCTGLRNREDFGSVGRKVWAPGGTVVKKKCVFVRDVTSYYRIIYCNSHHRHHHHYKHHHLQDEHHTTNDEDPPPHHHHHRRSHRHCHWYNVDDSDDDDDASDDDDDGNDDDDDNNDDDDVPGHQQL